MTQHHKSAHKNFYYCGMSKGFASKLPGRSLCLLTSFSLIGSGFVAASESSIYNNIVPTIENSQPKAAAQPATIVSPTAQPKTDFSERQARLKKKLSSKSGYRAIQAIRDAKSRGENTQQPEADSLAKKLPEVPQTAKIPEDTIIGRESNPQGDNNNNYIDPTEYKNPDTGNYQSPSSVVVTERSQGCQTILAAGACAKTTQTPPVAKFPGSSPTWLKKSATAKLPTGFPAKKSAWTPITASNNQQKNIAENTTKPDHKISWSRHNWRSRVIENRRDTPNYTSHAKAAYHRRPFLPHPGEFSTTTVSANPVAPPVGSLPAPVMEGNVAPRVSMVSYNFSLASVLPEVPYTNTIAYRGGNGSGMIFPLAIAAPITSLFGWRVHPITGDNRFHTGTDLGAPTGTPILAAAKGQVETANWVSGYGLAVIINHASAQQTLYGHMSEIFVQPGQWVEPGTVLGLVGNTGNSTGPHLHFEVRHLTQNGWVAVDPGVQLEGGINQLTQSQRIAQAR
ncbi:M23 family metallopeptidase [Dolichospermum planctonicum CS-1226]|uniref:M23 family metallopeptidase n=1 Tax=Dolichospermum planctonicum CS-1226 TaxID=3021751 RepID=A0ABT5ABG1_9CYAN|nr:M23 family metallopeptidase [Dolichospermum planctonicum]MDB9534608.1 M23 family metallopeptidase [Dolichospermum planctonicum CS-1226]